MAAYYRGRSNFQSGKPKRQWNPAWAKIYCVVIDDFDCAGTTDQTSWKPFASEESAMKEAAMTIDDIISDCGKSDSPSLDAIASLLQQENIAGAIKAFNEFFVSKRISILEQKVLP